VGRAALAGELPPTILAPEAIAASTTGVTE